MAVKILRPGAVVTPGYDDWTLDVGSSKSQAVDPLDPVAHDDGASNIKIFAAGTGWQGFYVLQSSKPTDMLSVIGLRGKVRWATDVAHGSQSLNFDISFGGQEDFISTPAGSTTAYQTSAGTADFPRPGGGGWSAADVLRPDLFFAIRVAAWQAGVGAAFVTSLWVELTYNPVPVQGEQARDVGSRKVFFFGRPRGVVRMDAPMEFLNPQLMDILPASHQQGIHAQGSGWGTKNWQRRPTRLLRRAWDPNKMTVSLELADARPYLAMFLDSGYSAKGASVLEDGVFRLHGGLSQVTIRDSQAWIERPGDRIVVQAEKNYKKLSADGLLIETASANELKRSSFVSGAAGLTLGGTGTNGSSIAVDTADLLFDSIVTPNSLKFAAGNAHTVIQSAQWPDTASISANVTCRLSIDHKDDAGAVLYWRLQRLVDSFYWHAAAAQWQVDVANNPLPVATSKVRHFSGRINVGTGATALRLLVLQPGGGAASRVNRVYHVQLEQKPYATSRIVTDAAVVSRAAENVYWGTTSANDGISAWPILRGTWGAEVIPEFDGADLIDGSIHVVIAATWPLGTSSALLYCYADGGGFTWRFDINGDGVQSNVLKNAGAISRGQVVKIVGRWTSDEGELGLAPRTMSLFVDGVLVGSSPITKFPADVLPRFIEEGQVGQANNFDGVVRKMFIAQEVLTDEEIAAL